MNQDEKPVCPRTPPKPLPNKEMRVKKAERCDKPKR